MKKGIVAAVLVAASLVPSHASANPKFQSLQPAPLSSPSAQSADPDSIVLPDGTPFRVELANGYSSTTAKVGDTIKFVVCDSVWVDTIAVIPQGMYLTGKVTSVSRARRRGRSGHVDIAFDEFKLPSGELASMRAMLRPRTTGDKYKSGMHDAGEVVVAATYGGPLVLLIPFFKGDEAKVEAGTAEILYLNGPLHVSRSAARALAPPSDSGLAQVFFLYNGFPSPPKVFCGEKLLGQYFNSRTYRYDFKPGVYWFSSGKVGEHPVRIEALENTQYLIERQHDRLVIEDFQQNQELIYGGKHRLIVEDLSYLPPDQMKLIAAGPVAQPHH